ncbi:MAG: arginine deiminase family protein [Planctomycetota bacterium]
MLRVCNEVGRLRKVLLHEPGAEVDQMVPAMMEDLLFDDILFGERAREEHRQFRRVLQLLQVETVEAFDLVVEALEGTAAREWLIRTLQGELDSELCGELGQVAPEELVGRLVTGVRRDPFQGASQVRELFAISPLPNWCFQRDPQIVMGDGVILGSMATSARWREALLARVIFKFHPDFAASRVVLDLPSTGHEAPSHGHLEGGDVLVLSPEVVAVGRSARTNDVAIEQLARALRSSEGAPRWLVVVDIPRRRACMHLDTLITPVDRDACLVHGAVILPGGWENALVYEIDLHARDSSPSACPDLLTALSRRGLDYEPILCGGHDPVAQQREQWTDGANCLCLAPGVITLYERNVATAEELARHGFRIVQAEDLLLGREELDLAALERGEGGRVSILLKGHEMARARGGPHCLTHPLVRDDV